MSYTFQLRRDTAANWTSVNPILADGEPGFEDDTDKLKIGDGVTAWISLPYVSGIGSGSPSSIAYSALPVGTTANTVAAGNDSRFTNPRTPSGAAGGVLTGSYPNPTLAAGYSVVAPSFSYGGPIGVSAPAFRWYNDTGRTLNIATVRASLGTAPTGSSAVVDLQVNGASVFSSSAHRPTITAGNVTATTTADTPTVHNGDYLTISITQVGSSTPGADLTLTVILG